MNAEQALEMAQGACSKQQSISRIKKDLDRVIKEVSEKGGTELFINSNSVMDGELTEYLKGLGYLCVKGSISTDEFGLLVSWHHSVLLKQEGDKLIIPLSKKGIHSVYYYSGFGFPVLQEEIKSFIINTNCQ